MCCKIIKPLVFNVFLLGCLLNLVACDDHDQSSRGREGNENTVTSLEKKYQHQLKAFQLQTVQNHDWNDVVADMTSGTLAGTFILSPLAMNLIHEGFSGKIVLMAERNGNGFVLSKKIKSVAELKSKPSIIAVPHRYSQYHVLLHTLLKKHAIPMENIRVLGMPPRDMTSSLRNGEIDGFVVGEPEGNRSISLGLGWMAAIPPQIWKDHMDHVFLASDTFINEQPEKLQELINQLVRGGQFIENNPEAAAVMGEDYTGAQAEIFAKVLTTPADWISYENMLVDDSDIVSMTEKMVEMQLWQKIPEDIIQGYIDMRFAIAADKAAL